MLSVMMTSPERVLFEGMAQRVIVPGERGTFEVLPMHRPLISRLLGGIVVIDAKTFPIRRGVIRVINDTVTAVVEPREAKP